jgi:hypothetical protein
MKHFSLSLTSVLALGFALVLLPSKLQGQAEAAATRAGGLQVGATITFLSPDLTGYLAPNNAPTSAKSEIGGIIYATFDLTEHLGATFEANYPTTRTPDDILEKTYMIGGRYVYRHNRYEPYAKVLVGLGNTSYDRPVAWISFPGTPASYGVFAYGAGLDYALSNHINIRAIDFEAQHWLSYPGGGVNPYMISVGAAYRFR